MANCFHEFRCSSCHKLLFKGLLVEGTIEIKCKHCHTVNPIVASQFNELLCLVNPCPHRIVADTPRTNA